MYTVKEIFYTLQGEGANVGRPAVFCRFAGCNLWTGRESDRADAVCQFCDTDFVGVGPDGGRFATAGALELPRKVVAVLCVGWPAFCGYLRKTAVRRVKCERRGASGTATFVG